MDSNLDLFRKDTDDILGDIAELDKLSILNIKIDRSLEGAINEMCVLENQCSAIQDESLIELCKDNMLATIMSQFGLASLFI